MGKIRSVIRNGAVMLVDRQELQNLFRPGNGASKQAEALAEVVAVELSTSAWLLMNIREKERTKHVHRLHPYKGKFIPNWWSIFWMRTLMPSKPPLISNPATLCLTPSAAAAQTLVQAAELGLHAIGIDVSAFNTLISNTKLRRQDLLALVQQARRLTSKLLRFTDEKACGI